MAEHESDGAEPQENLLSARSMARDAGRDVADAVKSGISDAFFTGLVYAGIFVAVILPIAGLAIGGLFLWLSISSRRSKFLPILIIVASIAFWIMGQSPLGLLPVFLGAGR